MSIKGLLRSVNMWHSDSSMQDETLSLAELYHENTKLPRFPFCISHKQLSNEDLKNVAVARTVYRDVPVISLANTILPDHPVIDVIRNRRSRRDFGTSQISLADLSSLLEAANGVTARFKDSEGNEISFRACPSAGALYPIEVYVLAQNVLDLVPGVYHHEPTRSALAIIAKRDMDEEISKICGETPGVNVASVVILLTANIKRISSKYGERGYRYALLEAGHLMHSLWLVAETMGFSFYTIGGFNDDAANLSLPIDGVEDVVCYVGLLGSRSKNDV